MLNSMTSITKAIDKYSYICKSEGNYLVRTNKIAETEKALHDNGYDCYSISSRYIIILGSKINMLI